MFTYLSCLITPYTVNHSSSGISTLLDVVWAIVFAMLLDDILSVFMPSPGVLALTRILGEYTQIDKFSLIGLYVPPPSSLFIQNLQNSITCILPWLLLVLAA